MRAPWSATRRGFGTALFYRMSWLAVAAPDGTLGYVDLYDVRPLVAASMAVAHSVTPTPSPSATRVPVRPPYLTVATAAANLRGAPAVSAPVLAVVPRRTPLALVEVRGAWAQRVGWPPLSPRATGASGGSRAT